MRHPLRRLLEKNLPPNIPAGNALRAASLSRTAGFIISACDFSIRYGNARRRLYGINTDSVNHWKWELIPGAKITPYSRLISTTILVFAALAVLSLASSALMYASFYQGGRSIYLMRRLPDSGKTLRKYVWSAPVRMAILTVLWGLALLVIYYLVWRFATPAQCLGPAFDGLLPTVVY